MPRNFLSPLPEQTQHLVTKKSLYSAIGRRLGAYSQRCNVGLNLLRCKAHLNAPIRGIKQQKVAVGFNWLGTESLQVAKVAVAFNWLSTESLHVAKVAVGFNWLGTESLHVAKVADSADWMASKWAANESSTWHTSR
jgi:hypothetical protein